VVEAAPAVMEGLVERGLKTLAVEEREGVAAELLRMVVPQVNSRMVATDVAVMVEISLRLILPVMTATTVRAPAVVVVVASHMTEYWDTLLEMEGTAHTVGVVAVAVRLLVVAEMGASAAAAAPVRMYLPLRELDQQAVLVASAQAVALHMRPRFPVDQVMAVSSVVTLMREMAEGVLASVAQSSIMVALSVSSTVPSQAILQRRDWLAKRGRVQRQRMARLQEVRSFRLTALLNLTTQLSLAT